jgi:hypothetical protein
LRSSVYSLSAFAPSSDRLPSDAHPPLLPQTPGKNERLTALDQRIRLVERFVEARAAVKTQPSDMIRLCNQVRVCARLRREMRRQPLAIQNQMSYISQVVASFSFK